MRLVLLSVGKPRDHELGLIHDRFAERIRPFGVRYETAWVPETRTGGRFSDEHVRHREARCLLERVGTGRTIALDRAGRSWTSEQLAQRLEHWATPCATLLVGGPLGLHRSAIEGSDECWSLSALTFPHELVRVLLVEQLYRAVTILRRVPYHK